MKLSDGDEAVAASPVAQEVEETEPETIGV
jgi:hypothetical protein